MKIKLKWKKNLIQDKLIEKMNDFYNENILWETFVWK